MTDPYIDRQETIERNLALIKELLKSENIDHEQLLREIARVLIAMYQELTTLGVVRNELARLIIRLQLFMDDHLDMRIEHSLHDAVMAKEQLAKAEKIAMDSQEMRAVLQKDMQELGVTLRQDAARSGSKTLPQRVRELLKKNREGSRR